MSLEVFGDEGDDFDVELLYTSGWESNPDATVFWREVNPDKLYTIEEAIEWYTDETIEEGSDPDSYGDI